MGGIVRGEFEENILEAEAHAFQLEKRPAFLDNSCRNRAANVLALGSLNRGQDVTRQRCRFNLHAAGARNLRRARRAAAARMPAPPREYVAHP